MGSFLPSHLERIREYGRQQAHFETLHQLQMAFLRQVAADTGTT